MFYPYLNTKPKHILQFHSIIYEIILCVTLRLKVTTLPFARPAYRTFQRLWRQRTRSDRENCCSHSIVCFGNQNNFRGIPLNVKQWQLENINIATGSCIVMLEIVSRSDSKVGQYEKHTSSLINQATPYITIQIFIFLHGVKEGIA